MNKKVSSFAERVGLMASSAEYLRNIAKIVEAEAEAMAEVQKRFEAKKPAKRPAKSTE